jgi:hypothetical protein
MTFRQELDRRLVLISESTVTDNEYAALTVPGSPATIDYYDACAEILTSRGAIGSTNARLNALALSLDNLTYRSTEASASNIFIGAALE